MDATGMAVLLGVIAVAMVVGFMAVWLRDAKRSEKVADNPERLDTEAPIDTHNNPASGR